MTNESLLKMAEAAGFAMASDENERPVRNPLPAVSNKLAAATPKDVLAFSRSQGLHEPIADWARAQFASILPVWHAKS